jgi:hypothetical protein
MSHWDFSRRIFGKLHRNIMPWCCGIEDKRVKKSW